ncbi:MAG: thermonuclease family protein [Methylocystis sp.]
MRNVVGFRRRVRPGRDGSKANVAIAVSLAIAVGLALGYLAFLATQAGPASETVFTLCDQPPHSDCVIDGDTFYVGAQAIRIADIDTPETHPPRCDYEAELGDRATRRLLELLNDGPLALTPTGSRDEDRYGRKLRVVVRDGRSLGDVLVSEGLARTWTGRREPWC